jgi:hypothetical protein
VYKIDDDNVLEPNVFELFCNLISDDVGCVGGIFIDESSVDRVQDTDRYNKIEDIYFVLNIQMVGNQSNDVKEVEHLYSNYFFKKGIEDLHPSELQPSGLREDTIFTHSIYNKGYKILVEPKAKIYHLDVDNFDGNRVFKGFFENKNENILIDKLREWNIIPNKFDLIEKEGKVFLVKDGTVFTTSITLS